VFIVADFIINSVQKLLDTPSYNQNPVLPLSKIITGDKTWNYG